MRIRLGSVAPARATSGGDSPTALLRGRWLLLARAAWMAITVLTLTLFGAGIPAQYARLATACPAAPCVSGQLRPESVRALHRLGLSLGFFATYALTLIILFAVVYGGVAAIIFWRRSDDRMALFVSITLIVFGLLTFSGVANALAEAHPGLWLPVTCLIYLGSTAFILFLFLFPDGHFVPHWTRWIALAWMIQSLPSSFFPGSWIATSSWYLVAGIVVWSGALAAVIYSQVYRYRRVSSRVQRLQTKWVVYGVSVAVVGVLVGIMTLDILDPLPTTPESMALALVGDALVYGALLCIPISLAIAMLRSRLFDVDTLISRTLIYGALTACVVALYVLIVGSLNVLFQTQGDLLIALVATGVVAVLFQPLRERLLRAVNRLIYGQRDEPYAVVSRMSRQLETAIAPDALLRTIAETVAQALKLPYVAVALEESTQLAVAASYGEPVGKLLRIPLIYQSENLGELQVAPRTPDDPWSPADRRLLDELARHTGAAAHAVRLTAELRRSNARLASARERLVTAREEERRRLRRDLHDGLGPALASLTLKVGATRMLIPRDHEAADALLAEMSDDIQATVGDIRRLVYDLRPPTLDELGLIGAIRERARQYSAGVAEGGSDAPHTLQVTVFAPNRLPALPAAVEVAAYRIALEAMTNVARHAHAHSCHVRLAFDEMLQLDISDDGIGLPRERSFGVGLTTMRERAAELGGACVVESPAQGGTHVVARLPILKES